jgi:soluble lytic murein transglycosylase-like protein
MKKLLSLLLATALTFACVAATTAESKEDEEAVVYTAEATALSYDDIWTVEESAVPEENENELIEAALLEQNYYNEEVPLTFEEQDYLRTACDEFDIPYALALGVIEQETNFRNLIGDDGASAGYMQIQQKWHYDRMERLGVTDLLNPFGNFRVGCDFLAELYAQYEDWGMALTVYNMGHYPGYISDYAYSVLDNYAKWDELVQLND